MGELRLLQSVETARYGDSFYIYDRSIRTSDVVLLPAQKVSERTYRVVRDLRRAGAVEEPRTLEDLQEIFEDPEDRSVVEALVAQGCLEPSDHTPSAPQQPRQREREGPAREDRAPERDPLRSKIELFERRNLRHYFVSPTFFGVPQQVDDSAVDVGIVGIPISSAVESSGTRHAPAFLRARSRRYAYWFDVYRHGVRTEVLCSDSRPALLCQDVVIKDYGDLHEIRTVGDIFHEVESLVDGRLHPQGIRPLFVGGDHAVTFPVVHAYVQRFPDLCLLHLDAHNDLFYAHQITYSHAATISNLLAYSGLSRVLSFGLRTAAPGAGDSVARALGEDTLDERVHMYSVGALRRLLTDPDGFRGMLHGLVGDRPCYLSIDLDVLRPAAVGHRITTPQESGLEWFELHELASLFLGDLDVVACDLTELNVDARRSSEDDGTDELMALMLLLIEGLARPAGS